jgi:hydroxyacyl-ACP dehydratase HTD2-like protein with hotdog domain
MKIENVSVGDELHLKKKPTREQLFRYSAMTWNPHRIHYDPEYAKEVEGHPDVLVQAQLHGAVMQELVMDWLNTEGELVELGWRNVGRATPNRTLHVGGKVTAVNVDEGIVELDVWTETDDGRAAEGTGAVRLFE